MDRTEETRRMQKRYVEVDETWPKQWGKAVYLKYLSGERTTQRQMINAKCYDCTGGFADGKNDCEIPTCALYPLMPYRDKHE